MKITSITTRNFKIVDYKFASSLKHQHQIFLKIEKNKGFRLFLGIFQVCSVSRHDKLLRLRDVLTMILVSMWARPLSVRVMPNLRSFSCRNRRWSFHSVPSMLITPVDNTPSSTKLPRQTSVGCSLKKR